MSERELSPEEMLRTFHDPLALYRVGYARAAEIRWEVGRKLHGPKWVGAPPLLEGYVELIDLWVYLHQAQLGGSLLPHRLRLFGQLLRLIEEQLRQDIDFELEIPTEAAQRLVPRVDALRRQRLVAMEGAFTSGPMTSGDSLSERDIIGSEPDDAQDGPEREEPADGEA